MKFNSFVLDKERKEQGYSGTYDNATHKWKTKQSSSQRRCKIHSHKAHLTKTWLQIPRKHIQHCLVYFIISAALTLVLYTYK